MTRNANAFLAMGVTALALAFSSAANADSLILNTGEKLDCTVLEETATHVRIEYQVTKTIKDERLIPLTEIAKVIRLQPDEIAFKELEDILPTADRLTVEDYDTLIDKRVRVFLTSHPSSPLISDVKKMHAALVEERLNVVEGARKVNGKWMSAEQYEAQSYDLDAQALVAAMEEEFEEGQYISGLRHFDEIERDFGGSTQYPTAIRSILSTAPRISASLNKMAEMHPLISKNREQGLANLPDFDRSKAQVAISNEVNAINAKREEEKLGEQKWRTVYKFDLESITEALTTLEEETTRLTDIDQATISGAAALASKASAALAGKRPDMATKLINQSREAGGNEDYLVRLETQVAEQQAVVEAEAAAAEAAAKAEIETEKALGAVVSPAGNEDGQEGETAEGSGEAEEATASAEETPAAEGTATADNTPNAGKSAEEASPRPVIAPQKQGLSLFNKILMALAAILVLVTIVAILNKKKGEKSEDGEIASTEE